MTTTEILIKRLSESTSMLKSLIHIYGPVMSSVTRFGIEQQISENIQIIVSLDVEKLAELP